MYLNVGKGYSAIYKI